MAIDREAEFRCLMRVCPSRGLAPVLMTNATGFDVGLALDTLDCDVTAR